ncbi:MAG: class I SAM-dependent methyltransferase [Planctomycetota bacterium]
MLQPIVFPQDVDARPIPHELRQLIADVRSRVEAFQDCWDRTQIEQFVAADYELVWQCLDWIVETQPRIGDRFLEWGCGFAAMTVLAASLGLDAIGIEAELELHAQGTQTLRDWLPNLTVCRGAAAGKSVRAEIACGNFLPPGTEAMADDPTLPSLGHGGDNAYERLQLELDDFAIVYSYPWPGEEGFHQDVFHKCAEPGAILIQFLGPYDVAAWRRSR